MDIEDKLKGAGMPDYFIQDFSGRKFDLQSVTIEKLMTDYKRSDIECWEIIHRLKTVGVFDTDVKRESKIFNDPIHGQIVLHPVCLAIIDTPQFQRLRNIKQLGMCYYVYPGASNNRFEHSLGVCYLAGQFARTLQKNQPYLGITEKDILCVEVAGLSHDLGHGPFSHVFDGLFMPAISPNNSWKHEDASLNMFDFMIKQNVLIEDILNKYDLDNTDVEFIKEMIYGPMEENRNELIGRKKHKHYLYEIVSNKRNGIDVDKWDYFARDCHHLGIQNNFDHSQYMKFARVLLADGEWQICIRDKEISNLYNMFYTRFTLHKRAYQHRVTKTLEAMVTHALLKANEDFKVIVDGQEFRMSDCIHDMRAYSQLTDDVLFKIVDSDIQTPNMKQAKSIIQRILQRDLFSCIYESDAIDSKNFSMTEAQIKKIIEEKVDPNRRKLDKVDFDVQLVKFDFGMKHENPIEKLLVYSKTEEDVAFEFPKNKVSRILGPVTFSELFIRVVCHNSSANEDVKKAAEEFVVNWQTSN